MKGKYIKCFNCGKLVYRYPRDLRKSQRFFCSPKCRYTAQKSYQKKINQHLIRKVEKICLKCGKKFIVHKYRRDTAKFCSRSCKGQFYNKSKGNNWQGGKTKQNLILRNSIRFRLWRLSVFERDNFTCQKCDQKGGKLEAHHKKSFSKYPKLRFKVSNGQTLCKKCHKLTNNFAGKNRLI